MINRAAVERAARQLGWPGSDVQVSGVAEILGVPVEPVQDHLDRHPYEFETDAALGFPATVIEAP